MIGENIGLSTGEPAPDDTCYTWLPSYSKEINTGYGRHYGVIGYHPNTNEYSSFLMVKNSLHKMHSLFLSSLYYWADEKNTIWYDFY